MIYIKNIKYIFCCVIMVILSHTINIQASSDKWAMQLYTGMGWVQNHNAYVSLPQAGLSATHENLKFNSSLMLGIRGTYSIFPVIGLGLDLCHFFGPDQKTQHSMTRLCIDGEGCSTSSELIFKFNNNVTAITPIITITYPLLNSLQPYITLGPSLFMAELKDTHNFIPKSQSSLSTSIGFKACGGLNIYLNKYFGLFIEYQYNRFPVKTCYYNNRIVHNITLGKTVGKETFSIHSAVIGITLQLSSLRHLFLFNSINEH